MHSKRQTEGYLMIDHRNAPPLPDEHIAISGLPPGCGIGLFETPTYTCSHCTRVVVMNPLRTRDRTYCLGCDHHICDTCGGVLKQTGVCKTFKQLADEMLEAAVQSQSIKEI